MGESVRSARRAQRLTQDQAVQITAGQPWQLSRSALSAIERGQCLPSFEALIALSRALHIAPEELLHDVDCVLSVPQGLDERTPEELMRQGDTLFWNGDYLQAAARYAAAVVRLPGEDRATDDQRHLRATCESRRATSLRRAGALSAARAAAERLIATSPEWPALQAEGYMTLSACYRQGDNVPLALDAARRAVEVSADLDAAMQGKALLQQGTCEFQAERYEAALERFRQARAFIDRLGEQRHACHAEGNVAMCLFHLGKLKAAREGMQKAIRLARTHRMPALEASWRVELGRIALAEGRLEAAQRHARSALPVARRRQHSLTIFRAEFLLHLAIKAGDPAAEDRQRLSRLKRLVRRLEQHRGDPTVQEFLRTVEPRETES